MPTTLLRETADGISVSSRVAPIQRDIANHVIGNLYRWIERATQRTALRELAEENPHLLPDIGKSKSEALEEASKPFWQP